MYTYDQYICNKIHYRYLQAAKRYGEVPLPFDHSPTKIACIIEGKDREQISFQKNEFMSLIQPLLTVSGIEYEWIDASRRQHAKEYINQSQDIDPKLDESSVIDINFPQGSITEYRIYEWLKYNCSEIREATRNSWSVVTPVSFMSYISSWIWPFSQKQPIQEQEQELTQPIQLSKEDNVKKNLSPPRIHASQFHQGILSFDESTFNHVLNGIRKTIFNHKEDMDILFQSVPIRLGYIPLKPESLYQRWFNHRNRVQFVSDMALSIISEHSIQWNNELEQKYSPNLIQYQGLLYDRVLLFKPLEAF